MNPGEKQEDRWWIVAGLVAFVIAVTLSVRADPAHAGTAGVTRHEFSQVQEGWPRWKVQHVFGTTGKRVLMYATDSHRYLIKSYPAKGGGRYKIEYRSRLAPQPYVGPYHVIGKSS
jgi:hypothetical protein